jgi:WD40 repeat protein
VTSLAFTADGRYLISGGLPDARLRPELAYASLVVWDVATRKSVHEERSASPIFQRIALAPDGRTLLTAGGDSDSRIRLWRLPESVWPEEQGWTQLFNGKDLTGWKTDPRQPDGWKVENGLLIGESNPANRRKAHPIPLG